MLKELRVEVWGTHLHLLQAPQFCHEILDLSILLREHGVESLHLSGISPGALELHQGGDLDLHIHTHTSPQKRQSSSRASGATAVSPPPRQHLHALHLLFAEGVLLLQRLVLDFHADELLLHLSTLVLQLENKNEKGIMVGLIPTLPFITYHCHTMIVILIFHREIPNRLK